MHELWFVKAISPKSLRLQKFNEDMTFQPLLYSYWLQKSINDMTSRESDTVFIKMLTEQREYMKNSISK